MSTTPDESRATVREQIVNALCEGFGHEHIANVEVCGEYTDVWLVGDDEPIRVEPLDVVLPEKYHGVTASLIGLDVRTILIMNEDEQNSEEAEV